VIQGIKTKVAAGGMVILLASAPFLKDIIEREGREYQPYRDIVQVLTVCDGITGPDVIPGKTYTDAECNRLSIKAAEKHGSELLDCIHVRITQTMYESLASWAYNVGTGAACKSTAIRLINAGRYAEGCRDLMRWNRAGGKEVRGLTNRRIKERDGCLQGIPEQARAIA
jgi:lysozyme